MAWVPVGSIKGPKGDPGSDAPIAGHEGAADPHAQYAMDTEVVHNTGTETIAGAKTFSTPPAVPVGNLLTHPVRRDDARLTDARTPTSHGHDGGDILQGTINVLRLPRVMHATTVNTTTAVTTYAVDANLAVAPLRMKFVMLHDCGIAVPTNPVDGQIIRIAAYASGAQRVFTFAGGIRLSTGLTARTVTIPFGQVMLAAIEYVSDIAAWVLTAATVSAT